MTWAVELFQNIFSFLSESVACPHTGNYKIENKHVNIPFQHILYIKADLMVSISALWGFVFISCWIDFVAPVYEKNFKRVINYIYQTKKNYSYKVLKKRRSCEPCMSAHAGTHTHKLTYIYKLVTAEPQTACKRVKTTHNQMCHCKSRILGYILWNPQCTGRQKFPQY